MDCLKLYKEECNNNQVPSCAEAMLCYISVAYAVVLPITIYVGWLETKAIVLLIPPAILWIFMRASRKDMNATSNLLAGMFGGIGGALVAILMKLLKLIE